MQAIKGGLNSMTMDEINTEVAAYRRDSKSPPKTVHYKTWAEIFEDFKGEPDFYIRK